jgi:hypothetical protein
MTMNFRSSLASLLGAYVIIASLIACGDDSTGSAAGVGGNVGAMDAASSTPDVTSTDAGATTDGGGKAAFGAACTQKADCESALCEFFPMLGSRCTQRCTADPECPSASMAQKCNLNGFCRP